MPESTKPSLTLYVQSRKAVTSFYRPPRQNVEGAGTPSGDIAGVNESSEAGEQSYFLSDDQARAVAMAEELAAHRGYTIEVKDVARSNRLERLVTEHLRNVTTFPVLVAPDGTRLEGTSNFTEERLCELMPTEMRHQRAFTYLKIRGGSGNFDEIRQRMLAFAEVREVHFLTGDWDAFVVLEFNLGVASKRQVLDFVTQRIRGIDSVTDTSTIVPEFSVTKFPI
jgi:Lrp/AsnC ligand binding domain